ncbi:hypothetical protein MBLNU13_g11028t1 [Cladosporium sp. NU13]
MEDQSMAAYDPPDRPETAAHETENSHKNHPNRPHADHPAHHNKNKKNRNFGAKAMKNLAAQDAPCSFAEAVLQEAMNQHSSSGLLGSLLGETDACPTAFHSQKKGTDDLTFIQHSAMVACLVLRDGQLSHPFSTKACRRKRHHAAAMLLMSVIMDTKTNSEYFLRIMLAEQRAKKREAQRIERRASSKEVSRVFRISSSEMLGSVGRALEDLQHKSDCKISLCKPELSMDEFLVVLAGSSKKVGEAEQEVVKILTDNTEVDLLSAQAEELNIQ